MAAGSTYTPIATTTLGSSTAGTTGVTFSSIPTTYTDLILVVSYLYDTGNTIAFQVGNGSVDTGTNYSWTWLAANGSSASSGRGATKSSGILGGLLVGNSSTSPNVSTLQLQNYSNTTTYKTGLVRAGNAANETGAFVNLWRSTSAINTLKISASAGNFLTGSTFTLYGILAA